MTRIYIAGPITGLPDLNKPAFDAEELYLSTIGVTPVSPFTIERHPADLEDADAIWQYYMKRCIPLLCGCDGARFLPGWEDSRGAKEEHRIAMMLGIPCMYVPKRRKE